MNNAIYIGHHVVRGVPLGGVFRSHVENVGCFISEVVIKDSLPQNVRHPITGIPFVVESEGLYYLASPSALQPTH